MAETPTPKDTSYWSFVTKKRQLARDFVDNPSRQSFTELCEKLWALKAFGSVDYYLDEYALDGQTPGEIAAAFEHAIDADEPGHVTDLRGFNWPVVSEVLRALEPEEYAVLNKRSVSGMEALGYDTPNPKSASQEQYMEFVEDVRDAATRYPLRTVAREAHGPIPDEITMLEVADGAFTTHFTGEVNLSELDESSREWIQFPDELKREVEEEVDGNARYRDVTDFLYSAVRNELDRASN